MGKSEAIEELKKGNKITHNYFSEGEFVTSNKEGTVYTFEDGVQMTSQDFWQLRNGFGWNNGYSLV